MKHRSAEGAVKGPPSRGSREKRGERGSEKQNNLSIGNPSTMSHKMNGIKVRKNDKFIGDPPKIPADIPNTNSEV